MGQKASDSVKKLTHTINATLFMENNLVTNYKCLFGGGGAPLLISMSRKAVVLKNLVY